MVKYCALILMAFAALAYSDSTTRGPMAANETCDPGDDPRGIDWDDTTNLDYKCLPNEPLARGSNQSLLRILCHPIDYPGHHCMSERIVYKDVPPLSGAHRPKWPKYGEYLYLPPQRYVHSLEHGAAVFLHHPCANGSEITLFRNLARSCLYRYVFTPSRFLSPDRPFAILTWGCMLSMEKVDIWLSRHYLRRYAINRAPEAHVFSDGQYSRGLLYPAKIVSNQADSLLCPSKQEKLQFSSAFTLSTPAPVRMRTIPSATVRRREPLGTKL